MSECIYVSVVVCERERERGTGRSRWASELSRASDMENLLLSLNNSSVHNDLTR